MRPRLASSAFLAACALLAAASLIYELQLARVISEVTGNPTLWEAVSFASFLVGLGLRSSAFPILRAERAAARFLRTELLLAWAAPGALIALQLLEILYRIYVYDGGLLRERFWPFPPVVILGATAQVLPLLVGWLSGNELAFFLTYDAAPPLRRRTASVLAAYHAGGLAGTAAFLASLAGALDPLALTVLASAAGLGFVAVAAHRRRDRGLLFAAAASLAAMATLPAAGRALEGLRLENHYFNMLQWTSDAHGTTHVEHPRPFLELLGFGRSGRNLTVRSVTRIRTPYQVMDFWPAAADPDALEPTDPRRHDALFLNGRFQVSSATSATYHEGLAHVADAMAGRELHEVLILGGGDGGLLHEVLKIGPELAHAVLVDIDQGVLAFAKERLGAIHQGAFDDPRARVVVGDALAYLREGTQAYDAIFLDLTYPFDFDSARFLSVEFLRLARRRLAPGGFVAVGSPVDFIETAGTPVERLVRATMTAAGFNDLAAYRSKSDNFLVAGTAPLDLEAQVPRTPRGPLHLAVPGGIWPRADRRRLGMLEAPDEVWSVFRPRALALPDPFF